MTLIAQDILNRKFSNQKEEWRMIGKKITKWINENKDNIAQIESDTGLKSKLVELPKKVKEFHYKV